MINYQLISCSSTLRNTSALQSYFQAAYGERSNYKYPQRWSWLYGREGSIAALAFDGPKLIGFVGAMAIKIISSDRSELAAWSVDNFVLPAYRSRGIGTTLQRSAEAAVPSTLSTWVSTDNARIKERLGNLRICDLTVISLAERPKRNCNSEVGEPDPSFIASMAKLSMARYDLHVDRSEEYCRWRFKQQPLAEYVQLTFDCGISLVRHCGPQREGIGMIGDVFSSGCNLGELVELVQCSADWLLAKGCREVRFGTCDSELIALIGKLDGWKLTIRYGILVSESGSHLARCSFPFFSLSDSDLDQYPW